MSVENQQNAWSGLNDFLADVERKALVIAELATQNREEALDIVQDVMLSFARHYAAKPQDDWMPLFYRTLQNRIRDWGRRQAVRRRWRIWLVDAEDDAVDPVQALPDPRGRPLEESLEDAEQIDQVLLCLETLAERQKQAVLLRIWEGLDVKATALAMGCSAGSVKTHLSRGLAALRNCLGEA